MRSSLLLGFGDDLVLAANVTPPVGVGGRSARDEQELSQWLENLSGGVKKQLS